MDEATDRTRVNGAVRSRAEFARPEAGGAVRMPLRSPVRRTAGAIFKQAIRLKASKAPAARMPVRRASTTSSRPLSKE